MSYWTKLNEGLQDRRNHKWAKLLHSTMQQVQPDLVTTLEADGDLDAYLNVRVNDLFSHIRRLQSDGATFQQAKEVAFEDFLPVESEPADDYELEGGLADQAAALEDWLGKDAES